MFQNNFAIYIYGLFAVLFKLYFIFLFIYIITIQFKASKNEKCCQCYCLAAVIVLVSVVYCTRSSTCIEKKYRQCNNAGCRVLDLEILHHE